MWKKVMIVLVFAGMVGLAVMFYGFPQQVKPKTIERVFTVEVKDPRPSLFKIARDLVNETKDVEAGKVLSYIETKSVICGLVPSQEKVQYLCSGALNDSFGIVFLETSDFEKVATEKGVPHGALGFYNVGDRIFFLRAPVYGTLSNLLIFFHEGMHAYRHMMRGKDVDSINDRYREEIVAHEFQLRLLREIDVKAYEVTIEQAKLRFGPMVTVGPDGFQSVMVNNDYEPSLNVLYGSVPKDDSERSMRMAELWRAYLFRRADLEWPQESEYQKMWALFLLGYKGFGVPKKTEALNK